MNLPLFEKVQLILAQINKLAPDSQNSLVKQLRSFQNQLSDDTFQSGDISLFNVDVENSMGGHSYIIINGNVLFA